MQCLNTRGIICVRDFLRIEYRVCVIEPFLWEDNPFEYRFYPDYGMIALLDSDTFQGIPGINLSLKKEVYFRKSFVPTFISKRVPSKNQEDYFELSDEAGLEVMNPIQYLIGTKMKYSRDSFYVIDFEEPKESGFRISKARGMPQNSRRKFSTISLPEIELF